MGRSSMTCVRSACLAYAAVVLLALVTLPGCGEERQELGRARTQVVTGGGIQRVDVGLVSFTENLGGCSLTCSTAFSEITAGNNAIAIYTAEFPEGLDYGTLSFTEGNSYAVQITNSPFCVQLWLRAQTEASFADDSAKVRVDSYGYCEHLP